MRNDEDDDDGWWWQTGDFGSTETGSRPIVGSCFLYHKNQISCVNQEEKEGETLNGLQEKKKKKGEKEEFSRHLLRLRTRRCHCWCSWRHYVLNSVRLNDARQRQQRRRCSVAVCTFQKFLFPNKRHYGKLNSHLRSSLPLSLSLSLCCLLSPLVCVCEWLSQANVLLHFFQPLMTTTIRIRAVHHTTGFFFSFSTCLLLSPPPSRNGDDDGGDQYIRLPSLSLSPSICTTLGDVCISPSQRKHEMRMRKKRRVQGTNDTIHPSIHFSPFSFLLTKLNSEFLKCGYTVESWRTLQEAIQSLCTEPVLLYTKRRHSTFSYQLKKKKRGEETSFLLRVDCEVEAEF